MGLHEFFVGWFTGTLEDLDGVFRRLTGAMHPAFSMIVPSGQVLDRAAVISSVRAAHATVDGSFAIDIRDPVERVVAADVVVLTYEERHHVGERVDSRRICTAVLVGAPEAPNGVRWRHLHESFLPS